MSAIKCNESADQQRFCIGAPTQLPHVDEVCTEGADDRALVRGAEYACNAARVYFLLGICTKVMTGASAPGIVVLLRSRRAAPQRQEALRNTDW